MRLIRGNAIAYLSLLAAWSMKGICVWSAAPLTVG